jgi:hypothetical protein
MEVVQALSKEIRGHFKPSHQEIKWEDADRKPLVIELKEMRLQLLSKRI